jgi:hypothetical protein
MKWRGTKYQDPEEGEKVLIINPQTNDINMAFFDGEFFFIFHQDSHEDIDNIKWWMRLSDIRMPGETWVKLSEDNKVKSYLRKESLNRG